LKNKIYWAVGAGIVGGIIGICFLLAVYYDIRIIKELLGLSASIPIDLAVMITEATIDRGIGIGPPREQVILSNILIVILNIVQWAIFGVVFRELISRVRKLRFFTGICG
jgi:hypothetical protein